MTTITLEVTDDLAESIAAVRDRLPEIIALGLNRLSPMPAQVYSHILTFLASGPTAAQLVEFRPTDDMAERLEQLLDKSQTGELSDIEEQELEEYRRIEHLVVMLKARALPYIISTP